MLLFDLARMVAVVGIGQVRSPVAPLQQMIAVPASHHGSFAGTGPHAYLGCCCIKSWHDCFIIAWQAGIMHASAKMR